MQNYFTFLCLFLSLFLQINLFGSANLTIIDPQRAWDEEQGTIESASISVTPSGIYSEVSIIMEISDRDLSFYNENLEIILDFQLPEKAFVTDSWLWIEEDIIKGEMWDRWSATQIYESVIDRNQDPSVLYKNSDTDYQLRIFPLPQGESRKVKMTYMLPGEWTKEEVAFTLPIEILKTSKRPLDKFELYTYLDAEVWQNQRLRDVDKFEKFYEEGVGFYYKTDVLLNENVDNLKYIVDAPLKNDVFVQSYTHDDDSYYELVCFPDDLLNIEISNRVVVLIDFDKDFADISRTELINKVKEQLKYSLGPNDYFNIIFSRFDPYAASENWISYNDIDETFDNLPSANEILSNNSNLKSILETGVDFINDQDEAGSVLLVSNSNQYHELDDANEFLSYINSYIGDIKINVFNYHYFNRSYHYYGGQYFSGSEYLFQNISETNFGEYVYINSEPVFSNELEEFLGDILSSNIIMDAYYGMSNGITYERFDMNSGNHANINKPIMQVGKYIGDFPMDIELTAIYESEVYSENITMEQEDVLIATDSTLKSCWVGNEIQELENLPITNAVIGEIIHKSKRDRVLSLYTTLICLEPSLGGEICDECVDDPNGDNVDEDVFSSIDEIAVNNNYTVYPNPFFDFITFDFENLQDLEYIEIYDATGKLIKRFELTDFDGTKIVWNGSDEAGSVVAAGMYLLRVVTTDGVSVEKIMKK